MKTRDAGEGFPPSREFSQTLPRLSLGYEGKQNIIYIFYKIIIFRLNKEKVLIYYVFSFDTRRAYVYFNFFHEKVISHNFERANLTAHTFFVLHSTMKTYL